METVEVGQKWRSKRNGRVVEIARLFRDESNDVIGIEFRDGSKRRTVSASATNVVGYELVKSDYVDFGEIARNKIGGQSQYVSRYIDGKDGTPAFGDGLRFRHANGGDVDVTDYHFIQIHKDDVETFVTRVKEYRERVMNGKI